MRRAFRWNPASASVWFGRDIISYGLFGPANFRHIVVFADGIQILVELLHDTIIVNKELPGSLGFELAYLHLILV